MTNKCPTLLFITSLTILTFFSSCVNTQTDHEENIGHEVISPNQAIKVSLVSNQNGGRVYFNVLYKSDENYVEVLPHSQLGITRTDSRFTDNLTLIKVSEPVMINEHYEMITGKRKVCSNKATERVFEFVNDNKQPLNIILRAYNDGVAFRYEFANSINDTVNIIDEATIYTFPDSTERWTMPFETSYEDFFTYSNTGLAKNESKEWGYPALFKVNQQPLWILVSEANIGRSHCATRLSNSHQANSYKVSYPPVRENFNQKGVKTTLPWQSPWRTLIVGSLSDLVSSTLITDVSNPGQLSATDWIVPGAASWIYWAHNHGSKDFKKVVEYIDLAVEMKWDYVLIDWEWDVMENGGKIQDAVRYAKNKGIKPLIWYNSGTSWLEPTPNDRLITSEKRAKEFAWLNEMGIYGIKVDFFAGDQQDMMQFYIDLLEQAAEYKLMVNFHGATTPRGWERTYPNLMTTEAVYGAEWYNNKPVLTEKAASHNATLPFTRNIIGSMDYTPVTFSHSQHPHITSYAHELALSVVFESGLQHFADRPEAYKSLPPEPKEFLKTVPVSWDNTKLIAGYPGESIVMARKKGEKWFIAGLNGKNDTQTLSFSLDFIANNHSVIQLIKDGDNNTSFEIQSFNVNKDDVLNIDCLPQGGFIGTIIPIND